MTFILDGFKTYVNTFCYNNDENCDLLNCKIFSIEDVDGISVFLPFYIKTMNFQN